MKRSVVVTFAVGLVSIAVALVALLARSPLVVAGTNSISAGEYIELNGNFSKCQAAGTIPQGTSAIRVAVEGIYFAPAVTVRVLSGAHVLREGRQVAGGGPIPTATVPLARFAQQVDNASICTSVGPTFQRVRFAGVPDHAPGHNPRSHELLRVEYLRAGSHSWWSLVRSIARHIGLGHAPSGTWPVLAVIALMLALVILTTRLTLKELQ